MPEPITIEVLVPLSHRTAFRTLIQEYYQPYYVAITSERHIESVSPKTPAAVKVSLCFGSADLIWSVARQWEKIYSES